jgi:hypothetical protein
MKMKMDSSQATSRCAVFDGTCALKPGDKLIAYN